MVNSHEKQTDKEIDKQTYR